jgi:predicted component of type VI protein secretion system
VLSSSIPNMISRNHAKIVVQPSKDNADLLEYLLYDSNSSNGTFVNDKRLAPNQHHRLNLGDLVRFGVGTQTVKPEFVFCFQRCACSPVSVGSGASARSAAHSAVDEMPDAAPLPAGPAIGKPARAAAANSSAPSPSLFNATPVLPPASAQPRPRPASPIPPLEPLPSAGMRSARAGAGAGSGFARALSAVKPERRDLSPVRKQLFGKPCAWSSLLIA